LTTPTSAELQTKLDVVRREVRNLTVMGIDPNQRPAQAALIKELERSARTELRLRKMALGHAKRAFGSRGGLMVPPTSLTGNSGNDDVARTGNSRSPALQMRVTSRRVFSCCNQDELSNRSRKSADDGIRQRCTLLHSQDGRAFGIPRPGSQTLYWHDFDADEQGYLLSLGEWRDEPPPPPTWREYFISERIPHQTPSDLRCPRHMAGGLDRRARSAGHTDGTNDASKTSTFKNSAAIARFKLNHKF
jgi:hypothetical protein